MGASGTRARTRVPCIGRQILNDCATREVWINIFKKRRKKFILLAAWSTDDGWVREKAGTRQKAVPTVQVSPEGGFAQEGEVKFFFFLILFIYLFTYLFLAELGLLLLRAGFL